MNSMKLPLHLTNKINFSQLFKMKPEDTNDVLVYNKETEKFDRKKIFRSYVSYLKTPDFDPSTKKSYMFLNKKDKAPNELLPILDYVQAIDSRYNQMVINWYNENDYIEMHRDCTAKMLDKESPVLFINLNESDNKEKCRKMVFENVATKEKEEEILKNKYVYTIDNNVTHRHGVGKGKEKRISITFRMMK